MAGIIRERQLSHGDILVVLGGGAGVEHLAELYWRDGKPVVSVWASWAPSTMMALEVAERYMRRLWAIRARCSGWRQAPAATVLACRPCGSKPSRTRVRSPKRPCGCSKT